MSEGEEQRHDSKPHTNWHKRYNNFWQSKFESLKRHKLGAAFILTISILGAILPFINTAGNFLNTWNHYFKSERFVETTVVSRKEALIGIDSTFGLFHQPFQFFDDTSRIANNEIIDDIELSNGDININVVPADQQCGNKYVLYNTILSNNETVHKLIPIKEYDNDEPEDWSINQVLNADNDNLDDYANEQAPCDLIKNESEKDIDDVVKLVNPGLEINIQNTTNSGILINNVIINVKKSAVNSFPIIMQNFASGFYIPLYNEGFGTATNLIMNFNIKKRLEKFDYKERFKYHLALSKLKPTDNSLHFYSSELKETLDTFFIKEGVNVRHILKHQDEIDKIKDFAKKGVLGRFKDNQARVYGTLAYDGILADGTLHRDTINFNYITDFITPAIGGDPIVGYRGDYNIKLLSSGKNYQKKYNVTNEITANGAKKLKLFFYSGNASFHLFDLLINYNNGKSIVLKNIFVYEFFHHSKKDFFHSAYTHRYNKMYKIKKEISQYDGKKF
jgi:hypothetical protein